MTYRRGTGRIVFALTMFAIPPLLLVAWVAGGPYTEAFPRPFDSHG